MRMLYHSVWILTWLGLSAAHAQMQIEVVEHHGDHRAHFQVLERVRLTPPAERAVMASRLLELLEAWEDNITAMDTVCDALRLIASEASIPKMRGMLADDAMSVHALQVLQAIESGRSDAALRDALGDVSPATRIAVVTTLGLRRDPAAVEPIARLLSESDDMDLWTAGLHALARIGTPNALSVLREIEAAPEVVRTRDQAILDCAYERLTSDGIDATRSAFADLAANGSTAAVRTGALRGYLMTDPEAAAEAVRTALAETNQAVAIGAAMACRASPSPRLTAVLIDALDGAPPSVQAAIVAALADPRDVAAAPAVLAQLESEHDEVREQAVFACEWFGGVELVPALLALAERGQPTEEAARFVLGRKPSTQITAALQGAWEEGGADAALLIDVLDRRNAPLPLPQLMAAAERGGAERRAALRVMSRRAGADDVPAIRAWMDTLAPRDRQRAVGVILDATDDIRPPDARFEVVFAGSDDLTEETRAALMAGAPRIGGSAALAALEQEALAETDAIQDAAIRSLCKWSDPEAMDPLHRVLDATEDETHRVLLLRGLAAQIRDHVEPRRRQEVLLERLRDKAERPEEQTVIDAALKALNTSSK